jgi:hypothetical protein
MLWRSALILNVMRNTQHQCVSMAITWPAQKELCFRPAFAESNLRNVFLYPNENPIFVSAKDFGRAEALFNAEFL